METLADYIAGTPAERAAENNRRGWANTPPAAQTHRGKPATWTMRGYLDAAKPGRTPTHRADGAPITPAWAQTLLASNGKDAD